MSELNINRNTFLEKEELTRLQQFMINNVTHDLFVANTTAFGVVQSDFDSVSPLDWLIQAGTNPGTIKITRDSRTFDSSGLMSFKKAFDNLAVPEGDWYWVRVQYDSTNTEVGTVSIDASGDMTGTLTEFVDVLRGQATDVPTKIRFVSETSLSNDSIYEIVQVDSATSAIISGASDVFVPESGLQYVVIGATPVGESISGEQENGLYKYDACSLELVAEETLDTQPSIGYVANKTFYVARIYNTSGTVTIQDKRDEWWEFNIRGLADKMDKASNLSDLVDIVQARANLGVYSTTEVDTKIQNIPYKILYGGSHYLGDIVDETHTITFPSVGTAEYYVMGTIVGASANPNNDNNANWVLRSRTATSFTVRINEFSSGIQNITFEFILIKK